MKHALRYSYIDFARAIGEKRYIFREDHRIDLLESIEDNPLIKGILNVGPYFIMLGNVQTWETLFVSEGCEKITGYTIDEAYSIGPQLLVNFNHPEDYSVTMETNRKALSILYQSDPDDRPYITCIFYYRGVHKNGNIMSIQQQVIPVSFDMQGNPYVFAMVITDISHLQMPQIPKTVLIDHKRNEYKLIEPGQAFVDGEKLHLSARETEVLRLLASGYTTKDIASKLGITFHTAATYRKRLREKTGVNKSTELVNFALVHALL